MNDSDDLTPWEDINPPMASAARRGLPCKSSDDEARTVFRNELTACLTLVAPVGMDETARRDWFAVAWDTLRDIEPELLARAAKNARKVCDHPSKIVPAIVAEVHELTRFEREMEAIVCRHVTELPSPPPEYVTPAEASRILEEFGLKRQPTG